MSKKAGSWEMIMREKEGRRKMKWLTDSTVRGLALLAVAGAGLVVYWLICSDTSDPFAPLAAWRARAVSNRTEAVNKRVTYRFLYPDEPGGVAGKLRLARFVDCQLYEDVKWDSYSVVHWRQWAADIFAREMGWVAQDQPGWLISRWLCADESTERDRDHLFWTIQALRFLDSESTDKEILMIEGSGKTARVCLTQGCSDYDYCQDTLYWNPNGAGCAAVDKIRGEQWFRTDPLIALAHQLRHMRHDFCQNGDAADGQERERIAVAAENFMRDVLSRKDPTRPCISPIPGH
jgi:hypothetical protein